AVARWRAARPASCSSTTTRAASPRRRKPSCAASPPSPMRTDAAAAGAALPAGLAVIVTAALVASGVAPYDRATWLLEVLPVLIALPLLAATRRRFPLTDLLYVLIAAHALVLILGGAHTYARVPLGFWLQDVFALDRNPYDKIGHFMQGFVPAMVA